MRVFRPSELAAMVATGRIRDGKTLLGLWCILRLTGDGGPPIMPPPKRRKDS